MTASLLQHMMGIGDQLVADTVEHVARVHASWGRSEQHMQTIAPLWFEGPSALLALAGLTRCTSTPFHNDMACG